MSVLQVGGMAATSSKCNFPLHGPECGYESHAVKLNSNHVIWESDNEDESIVPKQIPSPPKTADYREQMWNNSQPSQEVGPLICITPKKSKKGKFSPPASIDGQSGHKKQSKGRKRPEKEMRMRCKMVADWVEVMGPSAFTTIVGCDMQYLRALLRDKVNITDTILDKN